MKKLLTTTTSAQAGQWGLQRTLNNAHAEQQRLNIFIFEFLAVAP